MGFYSSNTWVQEYAECWLNVERDVSCSTLSSLEMKPMRGMLNLKAGG